MSSRETFIVTTFMCLLGLVNSTLGTPLFCLGKHGQKCIIRGFVFGGFCLGHQEVQKLRVVFLGDGP